MALFEGYDRRIDHINAVLKEYGINGIEDAKAICAAKGIDPYTTCKETQPICFENAAWAYVVGAAIALKKGCKNAAEAAEAIGIGLQAFCIKLANLLPALPELKQLPAVAYPEPSNDADIADSPSSHGYNPGHCSAGSGSSENSGHCLYSLQKTYAALLPVSSIPDWQARKANWNPNHRTKMFHALVS